jgi:hypothetical protein
MGNLPQIKDVVECLKLSPTSQSPGELRFGNKGSLSVNTGANTFYDHENEVGGGVFDFIVHNGAASDQRAAANWCKKRGLIADETSSRAPIREHVYVDPDGNPVSKAVKFSSGKWTQMRFENGGWLFGTKGVRRYPYGADRLKNDDQSKLLFIFEGEKDCERAWQHGLSATTNVGGAGKWRAHLNDYIVGRTVCIVPDNDKPGADHAKSVLAILRASQIDSFILDYAADLPAKGDFSDWMDQNGNDAQRFLAMAEAAKELPREPSGREFIATPYIWRDPATIEPRSFLYGKHLIRKQVSVTVAPGGVGKSTLLKTEALAMASGRELLGETVTPDLKVWIYNLEDERIEMERRFVAAMQFHDIDSAEIEGRLFYDTGRERPLCTAITLSNRVEIVQPEVQALEHEIKRRGIDVLVIDPFISSHQVPESDNGAIDLIVKEWVRLSDRCDCAIELVHHTRKTYGQEVTSEAGRGAVAMLAAARSGRALNKMQPQQREDAGIVDDGCSYFSIDRDKANLAPEGVREWRKISPFTLANGDSVGVCEKWEWPDAFSDINLEATLRCQQAIEGKNLRFSDQAIDWVGVTISNELGLDLATSKKRLKKIIRTWLGSGVLIKKQGMGPHRKMVPIVDVGEWINQ